MIDVALSVPLALAGAVAYRLRGMPESEVHPVVGNRQVRRALFLAVLALAAWVSGAGLWALAVMPLAAWGVVIGHGSYSDIWGPKCPDNEPIWKVTAFLSREGDPIGWRGKTVGMALTGIIMTVPLAFLPGIGWAYAGVGLLKLVCYALPWRRVKAEPTVAAEYAFGALSVGALAVA